jgi:2-C-methyl-D-erythritol 2,4-cyclodiphosphate synthase
MQVGFGFDAHRFAPERKLILGGVEIPHDQGLAGHSDADVLIHAIIDALLGAAGMSDIGTQFPDSDPKYKDISSLELLRRVCSRVSAKGLHIGNLDTTVVCESPRIGPHIEAMKRRLAPVLSLSSNRISIKGKTTEEMGFTGRGEGIAAYAVVLLATAPNSD